MKINGAVVYISSLFLNLLFIVTKSEITFILSTVSTSLAIVYYSIIIWQKVREKKRSNANVGENKQG